MWAAKGGVGTSVTACAAALAATRSGSEVLLVDLCGDLPSILGLDATSRLGVTDWLESESADSDSLQRLSIEVIDGLRLLPRGRANAWASDRAKSLVEALDDAASEVVIDAGNVQSRYGSVCHDAASTCNGDCEVVETLRKTGRSLLVTASCYLALRHSIGVATDADGVVVVSDPGRALGANDIVPILGRPLIASIERDPAVARAVDAGLLARRLTRSLERALAGLF